MTLIAFTGLERGPNEETGRDDRKRLEVMAGPKFVALVLSCTKLLSDQSPIAVGFEDLDQAKTRFDGTLPIKPWMLDHREVAISASDWLSRRADVSAS